MISLHGSTLRNVNMNFLLLQVYKFTNLQKDFTTCDAVFPFYFTGLNLASSRDAFKTIVKL